ncbi:helix-turn-helix domain-containing protein [Jiella sonneratiae]|uniref:Helix-turn-helix domain-containing protein n=1 Tax=Jiella sonneratiae TaxID=2816856 RepID=A0ABS3J7Q4_9HYPH|nr:hypothetical protein [Jiella sonneratiae]MBO0905682.1 hypothetical protein [Jiella sonneratiae]
MDDIEDDNPDWSDFPAEPLDYAAKLKATRARLTASQADFAALLQIPTATLRNWEQHRTKPDALGLTMIDLVYDDPEGMAERLRGKRGA